MSFACFHLSLIMCLPIYPSPNFIFCLQSSVCLYGGVRLFRLFAFVCVFHHLSLTFCLVLHLSPKPLVSNHMSALVVVSCSSFVMILFVFRACLWSLLPLCLLVVKIKIMFHHGFMRFTTYLPSCLPLIVSGTNAVTKIETVWHEKMLLVIHAVLS